MQRQNSDRIRKGRGAVSNASGRYERLTRETVDDGWDSGELQADMGGPKSQTYQDYVLAQAAASGDA